MTEREEFVRAARISGVADAEAAADVMHFKWAQGMTPSGARRVVLRQMGGKAYWCQCVPRTEMYAEYDPFSLEASSGLCGPMCGR